MSFFNVIVAIVALGPRGAYSDSSPFSNELQKEYTFSKVLSEDRYILHWSFNFHNKSIRFAVNVKTRGWVGFGLSPSGSMEGADIVMGWIKDSGEATLEDMHGTGNLEPIIDDSQDWFLLKHQHFNGWTSLEFRRDFESCDDRHDLNIEAGTARVIWSWSELAPVCNYDKTCALNKHDNRGVTSINLLGGLEDSPSSEQIDLNFFTLLANNVTIPNDTDTTYWCDLHKLPQKILETEHYIHKISPVLTSHDFQYVHHMVVFLCPEKSNIPSFSGRCKNVGDVPFFIRGCTVYKVLMSWAVGGQDAVLPKGVAFPVGGPNSTGYVVLEVHYDNPNLHSGVVDRSGMRFYYSRDPPQHRAGVLTLGHHITSNLVIPPSAPHGYSVSGLCRHTCTQKIFPSGGVKVFGNIFHTHSLGKKVTLRHYRESPECGGWKELPPVDQNKRYDSSLQQFDIVQEEVEVLPGDALELQCMYINDRKNVTLGGYAISEEMCLAFMAYYPDTPLSVCVSKPSPSAYEEFSTKYFTPGDRATVMELLGGSDLEVTGVLPYFNRINWTSTARSDLETSVHRGTLGEYCITNLASDDFVNRPGTRPEVNCSLETDTFPRKCSILEDKTISSQGEKAYLSCAFLLLCLLQILISNGIAM